MFFQQDSKLSLPEKSTSQWRMGSSLSLASTTDEDSFAGTPKQRWADLSDDDDDFMLERSPSASRQEQVQEASIESAVEHTSHVSKHHVGNGALNKWVGIASGSANKSFQKQQPVFVEGDAHANFDRYRDGEHGRPMGCLRGAESSAFAMPSRSQGHAVIGNSAMTALPVESDVLQNVAFSDSFTVTLSGIPSKLCNDACIDAILWAAGVHKAALGSHAKKNGHVAINFDTYESAIACCNHFKACAWQTGKLKADVLLPGSQQARDGGRQPQKDYKGLANINNRPVRCTRRSLAQQM